MVSAIEWRYEILIERYHKILYYYEVGFSISECEQIIKEE